MDMAQIADLISNVGFPIAIIAWLIYDSIRKDERMETLLGDLRDVIAGNNLQIELFRADLDKRHEIEKATYEELAERMMEDDKYEV